MNAGRERRKAILESASRDPELLSNVPPVVAAGFGVLPLRRLGDVLTVACLPRANRQALRLLRDVLELEVVATPFEERLLRAAIERAYFSEDELVNFPTFRSPEFLEEGESAPLLRVEKVERPGEASCELAADELALASLTYRTRLVNLDLPGAGGALPHPERTQVQLGKVELAWRRDAAGRPLASAEPAAEARLLLNLYRFCEYRHLPHGARIDEHELRPEWIERFPFVVHPTEVQLLGVRATGALRFHVYDQEVCCEPGVPARFVVDYFFLSYGNRMHRSIDVQIHELERLPRASVGISSDPTWGGVELERWLGIDEPAADLRGAS